MPALRAGCQKNNEHKHAHEALRPLCCIFIYCTFYCQHPGSRLIILPAKHMFYSKGVHARALTSGREANAHRSGLSDHIILGRWTAKQTQTLSTPVTKLCVCQAFMHSDTGADLDCVSHALSNGGRMVFLSPGRLSNTSTRMERVGEMKKRWQDIKRVEHKTGTGGRLGSLTIQILPRTASHALTYARWGVCRSTGRLQMWTSLPKLLKEWEISPQKESFQHYFS